MTDPQIKMAELPVAHATRYRVGIVASAWHDDVVQALIRGAVDELRAHGVLPDNVTLVRCPGSFEIPVTAKALVDSKHVHAIIAIGVIVRGETAHFEYVASPVAHGLQQLSISTGVPCLSAVLATETIQQAWDRAGGVHGNKGQEAARGALFLANLFSTLHTS